MFTNRHRKDSSSSCSVSCHIGYGNFNRQFSRISIRTNFEKSLKKKKKKNVLKKYHFWSKISKFQILLKKAYINFWQQHEPENWPSLAAHCQFLIPPLHFKILRPTNVFPTSHPTVFLFCFERAREDAFGRDIFW
jgi:hypothetical protein